MPAKAEMKATLTIEDIRRVCGDILDWKVNAIEATHADMAELETAVAWVSGQDDVMGALRRPLEGAAAAIAEILTADDFADEDRR